MPILKRQKWEDFCQAYTYGETAGNATRSYQRVYGGVHRSQPGRLLQRPEISERVAELRAELTARDRELMDETLTRLAVSRERILAELARIAFSDMADYVRLENGEPVLQPSALDAGKGAVVQDVVSTSSGRNGEAPRKRVRVKLNPDKLDALVQLGKDIGMFVERSEVAHSYPEQTDAEIKEQLAEKLRKLAELGIDIPSPSGRRRTRR